MNTPAFQNIAAIAVSLYGLATAISLATSPTSRFAFLRGVNHVSSAIAFDLRKLLALVGK